ncbi:MAG: lactonase family protein [Puniceicoccaceae bacterium]
MMKLCPLTLLLIFMNLSYAETVFFGTNTGGNGSSKGIYATRFDSGAGAFASEARLMAEIPFPGFLAKHPNLPVLYSVSSDRVASYRIVEGGSQPDLEPLNAVPSGTGRGTHLDVHPNGKALVTVHYGDGDVVVFPLQSDGSIGERTQTIALTAFSGVNPKRQEGPHPHSVYFDDTGAFALIPDLGADATYIFRFNSESTTLTQQGKGDALPGEGPRHMKFSVDSRFVYVLNELGLSVDCFEWNAQEGSLTKVGSAPTLTKEEQAGFNDIKASEIRIHPNGKFLYAANREHDSISVFRIHPESGLIKRIQLVPTVVRWPRNFNIDPAGRWLLCAGQNSNTVGIFAINEGSGELLYKEGSELDVPRAICVLFAP